MKTVAIIHNPYSGNQKNINKTKDDLIKIANDNNWQLDFFETKKSKDAIDIMYNIKNYDLVVSMGGDGTFNEVVMGNMKRKNKMLLSHLPVGTTNDLKDSFGFKGTTTNIFSSILNGKDVSYDVLSINGIPFTYTAGVGLLLDIPYSTTKNDKIKFGYFAYINNGLKALFQKHIKLLDVEYEIDGIKNNIKTPLILVSNSNKMAGFRFYNNVKLNDNKFEVLLANTNSVIKLLMGILKIKMGKSSCHFKLIRTNNIKFLIKDDTKNWCIDGEKLEENSHSYDVKILRKINCRVSKKANNYS